MKFMYVVLEWEKFPVTEHGCLFVVVASDDNECFELLKTRCYYKQGEDKDVKNELIKKQVRLSKKFALLDDTTPSGIVQEMIT